MQQNSPQMTGAEAQQYMERYAAAAAAGKKCFEGPLYSSVDLSGLAIAAAPLTRQLPATELAFFQTSAGQTGGGYTRPMRYSETNLDGAPGQLPQGYEFIGQSVGVHLPPQLAPHLKDFFTRHASLAHKRLSHVWEMGAVQFWPESSFGHQSKSVGVTIANVLAQYGVNGAVGARAFNPSGMLFFPAGEVIKFTMRTYEPVFITTDGLTWNGGIEGVDPGGNGYNDADGAPIFIIMEGVRFESLGA